MDNAGVYSFGGINEPVSCLTHLVGAGVFTLLALSLIRRGRGNWGRIAVLGIFAYSAVFLLVISGLYHLCPPETSSRIVLWRLDHCAIFILIAGTFTPVHGILFKGASRWVALPSARIIGPISWQRPQPTNRSRAIAFTIPGPIIIPRVVG